MLNNKLEQAYEDTPALPIIGFVFLFAIVSSIFFFLTSFQLFLESDWSLHAILNVVGIFTVNFALSMLICKQICDFFVCMFKKVELDDLDLIIKMAMITLTLILYAIQPMTIDSYSALSYGNFWTTVCLISFTVCAFYIKKMANLVDEDMEIEEAEAPKEVLNVYTNDLLTHANKGVNGIELMEHYLTLLKEIEHVLKDTEIASLNERQINLVKVLDTIEEVKLSSIDDLLEQVEDVVAGINEEISFYILEHDERIVAKANRKLTRMGAKRDVQ